MISTDRRIAAFVGFSEFLQSPANAELIEDWAERAYRANNWFVPENVKASLTAIADMLGSPEVLRDWLARYEPSGRSARVGVVMAGNIPAVGFHDLLCVLISGHKLLVKPSKDDTILIRLILDKLCEIEPSFREQVQFVERINEAEAYIATGGDNTARYFDYYFSAKPHIIRKNRVSVALLSGSESTEELDGLCWDIFRYFGLGCRNVSKLFVPLGYDFTPLYERAEQFRNYAANHHKYFNNYEYNRSILLVNRDEHLDNGFFLIQESEKMVSPLSMVYFESYVSEEEAKTKLLNSRDKIQCVVSHSEVDLPTVPFGRSQSPGLTDYADGVDVMEFLSRL
jgi:hypothetical protein